MRGKNCIARKLERQYGSHFLGKLQINQTSFCLDMFIACELKLSVFTVNTDGFSSLEGILFHGAMVQAKL